MSADWQTFLQPEVTIEAMAWPQARLGEAIASLAKQAGLGTAQDRVPAPPEQLDTQAMDLRDEWVFAVAEQIGVEAEAVEIAYHEAAQLVCRAAPAILRIASAGATLYLALCAGGRREVTVLCPDLTVRKVATAVIAHWLVAPLAAPLQAEIEMLLATAQVPRHAHARTYRAMLRERLRATTYHAGWLLRISPRTTFWTQLRHQGVYRQVAALSLLHLLYYLAWLAAWYLVGRGVLAGNIDQGWLWGWALLLLLLVPLRVGVLHLQSGLTIRGGALLKDRLLLGALQLEPDETRHQGIGQLLGRVFESEALETLALTGGFLTLFATIELALSLGVLAIGAVGCSTLCCW